MNAISTNLSVPEIDALLGLASTSTFVPAEARHAVALSEAVAASSCSTNRVSLAEALRERYPSSPVVVLFLAGHADETLRAIGLREIERTEGPRPQRALDPRPSPTPANETLVPTLRESAAEGAGYGVASRLPTARSLGLTQRQMDVLRLIVQGKPNKLICRELDLAEGTVKCHVSAILRALDVGTRTQAALKGARLGLGADRSQAA